MTQSKKNLRKILKLTERANKMVEAVNASIEKFDLAKQKVIEVKATCQDIIINSKETCEMAKLVDKDAKAIEKLIEDKRVELTKPLLSQKKEIDDYAKKLMLELNAGRKPLRDRIFAYEQELERIRLAGQARIQAELRRAEEERLRREAEQRKAEEERRLKEEEAKRELYAMMEAAGISKPVEDEAEVIPFEPDEEPETAVTAGPSEEELRLIRQQKELEAQRSKNIAMVWTFKVMDPLRVPMEYLMIDEAKVKAAIKAGERQIPGIYIYQDQQFRNR